MKKILLPALALIFVSLITRANNYYVTTSADTGASSLRAMIDSANARTGLDTITLNLTAQDTIHIDSVFADISDSLVITGLACQNPTITGDSVGFTQALFYVAANNIALTLNYLNIINCKTNGAGKGAAVYAWQLNINYCYLYGNYRINTGANGSGIGGAVYADTLWAYNSSFNSNSAVITTGSGSGEGGALYARASFLYNCTFVNNYATTFGGAIAGTVNQMQNCTVTGNYAGTSGGAIYNNGTSADGTIGNSIFWSNTVSGISLGAADISGGCNILQDSLASDSFGVVASDVVGVNPQFGTFGYYSGCVPVLPILCGSIAQNHASCTGATNTDAQGIAAQGVRDAGAFEITSPHLYSDSLDSIQPGTTADLYNYFNTTGLTIQWPSGLNDSSATMVDTGTYTVIGTNFLGCSDTATITIIYATDTTTGINHLTALNGINLYPNPAKGVVTITWGDKSSSVITLKLTDMLGRTVLAQNIDGTTGKFTMALGSFSSGTYYVSANSGADNIWAARLIVLDK